MTDRLSLTRQTLIQKKYTLLEGGLERDRLLSSTAMETGASVDPFVPKRRSLSVLHRLWFGIAFIFGIVYIVTIPPFESGDELTHWNRLWAVAEGEVVCRTMPGAAKVLPNYFRFPVSDTVPSAPGPRVILPSQKRFFRQLPVLKGPPPPDHPRVGLEDFRLAWDFTGLSDTGFAGDLQCKYPPTGYLLPAGAARLVGLHKDGTPRPGGMLEAFYATRLVNWGLVTIALWLLLRAIPWGRNLLLFFYTVPEVLQQGTALNNDAFLFVMGFLILGMFLRPASWGHAAWIAVAIMAMTTIKPVYAPMALLAAPLYVALRPTLRTFRWKQALVTIGLVTPFMVWKLWSVMNTYDQEYDWRASWADPVRQTAFLKAHPTYLLVICWSQFKNFFGNGLLDGSWKSVIGAFGWNAFFMAPIGYYLVVAALVLAMAADATNGVVADPIGSFDGVSRRAHNLAWILAVVGILLVFPGMTLAMYLIFTTVGVTGVLGVQGRYFLIPFLLFLAMGLYAIKQYWNGRLANIWVSIGATVAAAGLMIVSNCYAVSAICDYFWVH
jgi:Predicted membrane protein (DUF2142)